MQKHGYIKPTHRSALGHARYSQSFLHEFKQTTNLESLDFTQSDQSLYQSADGRRHTIKEWSQLSGVPRKKIIGRLWAGHSIDEAIIAEELPRITSENSLKPSRNLVVTVKKPLYKEFQRVTKERGTNMGAVVKRFMADYVTRENDIARRYPDGFPRVK
jgi:hypothetical protein